MTIHSPLSLPFARNFHCGEECSPHISWSNDRCRHQWGCPLQKSPFLAPAPAFATENPSGSSKISGISPFQVHGIHLDAFLQYSSIIQSFLPVLPSPDTELPPKIAPTAHCHARPPFSIKRSADRVIKTA